jgi:glycosyltransferase involved in cell wall biosynthesis
VTRILIAADSSDAKKGGIPTFNYRFATAAVQAGHDTYMLMPAQDNTQSPEQIAQGHEGVKVAVVPNPYTPEEVKSGPDLLPRLLEGFVSDTPPDEVRTWCAKGGTIEHGYLPGGGVMADAPEVVIGHSRFSGLGPGNIVKGPRQDIGDPHDHCRAWYPSAKYAHLIHMEVERLAEVKGSDWVKTLRNVLFEYFNAIDADVVCCAGRGSFEWFWNVRERAKQPPFEPVHARIHELVPGAEIAKEPVPPRSPLQTIKLILVGRADDTTKNAEGAFTVLRSIASPPATPPKPPFPAHLTVLGMPEELVQRWQELADKMTNVPFDEKEHMVKVREYVPVEQVPVEIGKVDAVIIPSLSEAFSLVSVEGISQGKPVLSTYNNGFARLLLDSDRVPVDVGRCFVVQDQRATGDEWVELWAKKIRDLKDNLDVYYEKVKKIQEILKGYRWQDTVQGVIAAALEATYDSKQIANGEIARAASPEVSSLGSFDVLF